MKQPFGPYLSLVFRIFCSLKMKHVLSLRYKGIIFHNVIYLFHLFCKAIFWPVFIIATLATIVGSQAVISATFSIISPCRALRCFPRIKIIHTSNQVHGQIYIPEVNWILMVLCVTVVIGFRDTTTIGNAYGMHFSIISWNNFLCGFGAFVSYALAGNLNTLAWLRGSMGQIYFRIHSSSSHHSIYPQNTIKSC